LVKADDRPKDRRFPSVPCQDTEHMQSIELANVTGNHCQHQSFHRTESRGKAHHEDWLKVHFFSDPATSARRAATSWYFQVEEKLFVTCCCT